MTVNRRLVGIFIQRRMVAAILITDVLIKDLLKFSLFLADNCGFVRLLLTLRFVLRRLTERVSVSVRSMGKFPFYAIGIYRAVIVESRLP